MFKWVKAPFKNLFFGKNVWYKRIISFCSFLTIIALAYVGWIYIWAGDSQLNMCIQNREADKRYQDELLATIKVYEERLASKEDNVVFLERPTPPPPPIRPVEKGVIERAKDIVAVTAPQIKETVTRAKSKIFTDRRVGLGYIGMHNMNGISHGVYVRYDIFSVFGKSINFGIGGLYNRHQRHDPMMGRQDWSSIGFVFMAGVEL